MRWKDAYFFQSDCHKDELGGLCEIESLGWFLKEDEDYVYLVAERMDEDGNVRNPFAILKVNILERRHFTAPWKRRKRKKGVVGE